MSDLYDLSTIDWLEIIWIVVSLATTVFSGINWHQACLAVGDIKREGTNGLLKMWTNGMLILSIIMFVKALLLVAAGVIVLYLPNPVGRPPTYGLSEALRVVFISINLAICATSALMVILRKMMIDYRGGKKTMSPWDGTTERRKEPRDG